MRRCSWCNHRILYPFQKQSEGGTMHLRCSDYVNRITDENQQQYYRQDTHQQFYSYEDFLARLEDEDGGW